jgi:hypothetical protein
MPDYGPIPRVREVSFAPIVTRVKNFPSQRSLEEKLMGRVIYETGRIAGKQAAALAFRGGVRNPEELKFIRNFAQDKARSDTLRLLDELWNSREEFPEVVVEGKFPRTGREVI